MDNIFKTLNIAAVCALSATTVATAQNLAKGLTVSPAPKRAIMWFDGEANFRRFSCVDSIDYYLEKVSALGFTDVAVDVRPITGEAQDARVARLRAPR